MHNRGKNITAREVEAIRWMAMADFAPILMQRYLERPRHTIYKVMSKYGIKHKGSRITP